MISVCMATYNGAPHIQAQVESILAQLAPEDELIISDDGSTDSTLEILSSLNDKRLNVFHFGHKNLIKNFENALRKASGEYIFLADQDDVWHPEKVKICLESLKNGSGLVVSDCTLIDEKEVLIEESYFHLKPPREGIFANLYTNSFMGCCMAFHKNVLDRALPFPSNLPMHDSWIGLVALSAGEKVTFLEQKLVTYRRHGSALSTTGSKSRASWAKRLMDRWSLASRLTLRRLGLA